MAQANPLWIFGRSHDAFGRLANRQVSSANRRRDLPHAVWFGDVGGSRSHYAATMARRGVALQSITPFDAGVLGWIEFLILFATIVIADLTIRSFGHLSAARDMRLAIRSGMLFLLFACLFGFLMVWHGERQLALGKPHGVYGQAGVMKFHARHAHSCDSIPTDPRVGFKPDRPRRARTPSRDRRRDVLAFGLHAVQHRPDFFRTWAIRYHLVHGEFAGGGHFSFLLPLGRALCNLVVPSASIKPAANGEIT